MSTSSKPPKISTTLEPLPVVAVPDNPRARKLFIRREKLKADAAKVSARLEEIERADRQRRKQADIKAHQRLYFVLGKYVHDALSEDGSWLDVKFGDVSFRETLGDRDLDRFINILGQNAVEQEFADGEDDAANEGSFDQDDLDGPPGDAEPDEDEAA